MDTFLQWDDPELVWVTPGKVSVIAVVMKWRLV